MGELEVPDDALWGASTERAVQNFSVSGHRMPRHFIQTLGLVKWACARANEELGVVAPEKAQAIAAAALEIHEGGLNEHFPVDVFQTGSGTSTNMNANEVIANRINGSTTDQSIRVHPNDDVNRGQSSNDIIPTTLHLSVALALRDDLIPSLESLATVLERKSARWMEVIKIGRTHLMDAVPISVGQEFSGYAAQVRKSIARCQRGIAVTSELAIGGTAVGTGVNTDSRFAGVTIRHLSDKTGLKLREADNHFEAQAARDDMVEIAGILQAVATVLSKIANDIRLLGSGPRAGLGELKLPATQPGSSIMPGKVNPVMCEMLIQTSIYVKGLATAMLLAGQEGYFELNTSLPLLAYCSLESIGCLARAAAKFEQRCLRELEVDASRCSNYVENSLMLATTLAPHIGYDRAARIAKEALVDDKSIRQVALERGVLDEATLDRLLNPSASLGPTSPESRKPEGS